MNGTEKSRFIEIEWYRLIRAISYYQILTTRHQPANESLGLDGFEFWFACQREWTHNATTVQLQIKRSGIFEWWEKRLILIICLSPGQTYIVATKTRSRSLQLGQIMMINSFFANKIVRLWIMQSRNGYLVDPSYFEYELPFPYDDIKIWQKPSEQCRSEPPYRPIGAKCW
jgi:hypothetical protein